MKKLISIDLDGTLLNSYGEISIKDKEAIQSQIKNGAEVVLTSGRTVSAMENFAEELGANNYLISGNGTLIYDIKNKKNIYQKYLSKEKVLEIINICEENSIYYNVYTDKSIITKSINFNTLFYYSENLKKPAHRRTNIELVANIYEYMENCAEPILKITVCDNDKAIFNAMLNRLKNVDNIDVLDVSHMSRKIVRIDDMEKNIEYYYTEITCKDTDKWYAVLYLAKILNIQEENIITIGDNINDIKMIKEATIGVAMDNGNPKVKEVAAFVTTDNNSDGVSKILNILR